jgi:hypothetical protein
MFRDPVMALAPVNEMAGAVGGNRERAPGVYWALETNALFFRRL